LILASENAFLVRRAPLRVIVLALFISSISGVARAQSEADRATARELAREGQAAFDRGDFESAADRFARADALVHAPTLLLALARAQNKLGKLVQSYESYSRILREGVPEGSPPVFKKAFEDAKKEVEPIRARLGWVTIDVKGPANARVSIDDTAVPPAAVGVRRAVNPGGHVIKAEAEGFLPAEQSISVAEGESAAASLVLEPDPNSQVAAATGASAAQASQGNGAKIEAPPDAPRAAGSTSRTLGFVALGVGAAGLVVGGVTGVMALGKRGDLDDACPGGQCPEGQRANLDGYRRLGTVSTIGFIVGGVGAATGVTLLLTSRKGSERSQTTSLRLGASSVSVSRSFW
jgi:hypothetical protein